MECGLTPKQTERLAAIDKVYEQQKYMYDNKVHSVAERIVSISHDEKGLDRIEKMSFDAYSESDVLIAAVDRYFERSGHYPERVLADKIHRNRANLGYCKEHGIRLTDPSQCRLKKNAETDKKTAYKDNADRIAVERSFGLAKQKYLCWYLFKTTTRRI